MLESSRLRVFFYVVLAVIWHFWTLHQKKSLSCNFSPLPATGLGDYLFEKALSISQSVWLWHSGVDSELWLSGLDSGPLAWVLWLCFCVFGSVGLDNRINAASVQHERGNVDV